MMNRFLNLLLLVEKNKISDLFKVLNKISCLFNPKHLNAITSLHKLLNEISGLFNPKILNKMLSLYKLLNKISGLLQFLNIIRDLGLGNSIWDYPPNQQDEFHQAYIKLGPYKLIPRISRKDPGEFSNATRDRPFEVDDDQAKVLGNDDLTSKRQIAGGKVNAGRNGRKFNKTKRDWGSHFKMSSSSQVRLSKSVNNMVELIFSQIGKKGDIGGLKVVEKKLEIEDVIRH
ncbi:hypothetical protein GOBAR_AA14774 [Gossypium barbadense]|uniref:Uncharacterized protein n=1 Tax=Gossypium barbadense TaxID=3634 RepID=A0A2P5XR88_GOSBA|nr:hypothetical protein GOBAR_AA14774 [Gossypium barbadense]